MTRDDIGPVYCSLRAHRLEDKAAIVAVVRENVWPLIESGSLRLVIDRTLPMSKDGQAHRILESSGHIGKILLETERI